MTKVKRCSQCGKEVTQGFMTHWCISQKDEVYNV